MNSDQLKLFTYTLIGGTPIILCFRFGFHWYTITLLVLGMILGFLAGLLGRKSSY